MNTSPAFAKDFACHFRPFFVFFFYFCGKLFLHFQPFKRGFLDEDGNIVDGDLVEFGYVVD